MNKSRKLWAELGIWLAFAVIVIIGASLNDYPTLFALILNGGTAGEWIVALLTMTAILFCGYRVAAVWRQL